MNSFKLLLEKFDVTLRKYNLPNYEKLYPPLSDKEIDTRLNELGINDKNFKSLFTWKNGYDPDQNVNVLCQVFEFGALLSLDAIKDTVNANKNDARWDNQLLIPLVTDSTGQYILFNNEPGNDYGKLYLYSASLLVAIETIGYYDSISAMIETTIEAYEQGIQKYDEVEDWLDTDIKGYRKIATKYNVHSKYWAL